MNILKLLSRSVLFCTLALASCVAPATTHVEASATVGATFTYEEFGSAFLAPRNVTVWTPPGYDQSSDKLAVLYMHDGQNLFDDDTAGFGVEWGVDEHVIDLVASGDIQNVIVVGIWNTSARFREYVPAKIVANLPDNVQTAVFESHGGGPLSDEYLRFIVEELKPFIDKTYRTLPDREHTTIMGSSMGGLISLYAVTEYPDVFSAAGCISTHWPLTIEAEMLEAQELYFEPIADAFVTYLEANTPSPDRHKLYFDYGTVHLDALYEPYQMKVDAVLQAAGFERGVNWVSDKYQDAAHNETFWRERLASPLNFIQP